MNGAGMAQWTLDQVLSFLSEVPRIGRLATVTKSGDPHVAPVWFQVEGESILVHTMAAYLKAKNLKDHPRFALTVDTETWPYKGVSIRGSADIANSEQRNHQEFVESITVAYLGEQARSIGQAMAAMEGDNVTLILHPETWSSFDYSTH
jgi:PPOX class probable F420-dependent enzyme